MNDKLFGRKLSRYLIGLIHLPQLLTACWRALCVFERPEQVIWGYVTGRLPQARVIRLRDGHMIHLSDDPEDIVTVFLVFAREDYGRIAPNSVVIDIGANIGVFALFAAYSGARQVHAYEPSSESFAVLQRNIKVNGFNQVIYSEQLAVVGKLSPPVKFPRRSSVHNVMLGDDVPSGVEYDLVPTTTLSQIGGALAEVDVLKLDCEGAEYDILLNASRDDVRKAAEIRLEYHIGPRETLIDKICAHGFTPRQFLDDGEGSGYLWLSRKP